MSVIDTRHNVVLYTAGDKPFSGQRLAKIGYKTSKDKKTGKEIAAKFPSVAVSVPVLENWSEQESQALRPYFVALLQDTQDKVVKSLYESSGGKLTSVADSDICIAACIGYLAADDRLTKEKIAAWFDADCRDNLTVYLCELAGTENTEDTRVTQSLRAYRDLLSSISKDSGALQPKQIVGLRKAIEVSGSEDEIASRLDKKLEAMQNKPTMIEALGF